MHLYYRNIVNYYNNITFLKNCSREFLKSTNGNINIKFGLKNTTISKIALVNNLGDKY